MSSTNFSSFFFVLFLFALTTTTTTADYATNASELIRKSCTNARFSSFCYDMLIRYNKTIAKNPTDRQVSKVALALSIKEVKRVQTLSALAKTSTPMSDEAISCIADCEGSMDTGLGNLCDSWQALRKSGKRTSEQYSFNIFNLMTWASSALTNVGDCEDLVAQKANLLNDVSVEYRMFSEEVNFTSMVISSALAVFNTLQNY